jgi:hypothetical protein
MLMMLQNYPYFLNSKELSAILKQPLVLSRRPCSGHTFGPGKVTHPLASSCFS